MPIEPRLPTPWAVICEEHGRQYLTREEYTAQMSDPWRTWRCPCGQHAEWDDDNYEAWIADRVEE